MFGINEKKTRDKAVHALLKYTKCLDLVSSMSLESMAYGRNENYSGVTSSGNKFESKVEVTFDKFEKLQYECSAHIQKVEEALASLTDQERNILKEFYLKDKSAMSIYSKLHVSERTFYRQKNQALLKMSYAMRTVVFD